MKREEFENLKKIEHRIRLLNILKERFKAMCGSLNFSIEVKTTVQGYNSMLPIKISSIDDPIFSEDEEDILLFLENKILKLEKEFEND